jgi:hypothetical protein
VFRNQFLPSSLNFTSVQVAFIFSKFLLKGTKGATTDGLSLFQTRNFNERMYFPQSFSKGSRRFVICLACVMCIPLNYWNLGDRSPTGRPGQYFNTFVGDRF